MTRQDHRTNFKIFSELTYQHINIRMKKNNYSNNVLYFTKASFFTEIWKQRQYLDQSIGLSGKT